jgi:hypothetical protein
MSEMESVERLLKRCPRVDVGNHAIPTCGSSSWMMDDDDDDDEPKKSRLPTLFTSWAHGTPSALAWKDWNQHGRYMILTTTVQSPAGLWPFVLEEVNRRFQNRLPRQATLIYQFLQSRATPVGLSSF